MKKLVILGMLCFSIAGLSAADSSLEQLLGVSVDELGITFQVKSNGCTTKNDFAFDVQEVLEEISPNLPAFEHHFYITIKRLRPDRCEVFVPYGTHIFWSFEDLGIHFGELHINNPIGGEKITTLP